MFIFNNLDKKFFLVENKTQYNCIMNAIKFF